MDGAAFLMYYFSPVNRKAGWEEGGRKIEHADITNSIVFGIQRAALKLTF